MKLFEVLSCLCVVVALVLCKKAFTLTCANGATARTLFYTVNEWNETNCDGQTEKCLRIEAEFTILSGYITVSTELGGCAEVRRCNQKCSHVLQKSYEIAKKSGAYMPFDVTAVSSNTKTCAMACCHGDRCNKNNVKVMKKLTIISKEITATTTTTKATAKTITTNITATIPQIIKTITSAEPKRSYKDHSNIDMNEKIIIPVIKRLENSLNKKDSNASTPTALVKQTSEKQKNKQVLFISTQTSLQMLPTQTASRFHIKKTLLVLSLLVSGLLVAF